MTMYNETSDLLLRTLNSVIKNIAHLCTRSRSKTWGQDAWKKVVVCIVADGRKVVDPRVLKVLQLMGVYAEVSSFVMNCQQLTIRGWPKITLLAKRLKRTSSSTPLK